MSDSETGVQYISHHAANACIYTSYVVFLIMGLVVAYIFRNRGEFLAGRHTRKHFFLAMNFLASGKYSNSLREAGAPFLLLWRQWNG